MAHILVYSLVILGTIFTVDCICETGVILASGVDQANQDIITSEHNRYRTMIAQRKVRNQPRGINLKRMFYDADLAMKAQEIADTCVFEHVKVKDDRWIHVGQNLFIEMSTAEFKEPDWRKAIASWFNEVKNYQYPAGFSRNTGHYTQVVWADTDRLGCGSTSFKTTNEKFQFKQLYVCNYGPGGNMNSLPPYKSGTKGCPNLC